MDSDTDNVFANFSFEDMIDNYNTWKHLTVCKQISSTTF